MAVNLPISREEAERNIVICLILSLITCGIYNLIWQAHQMYVLNTLLKRNEFSFLRWLIFSILTCGIYHIYYQYCMGSSLVEAHRMYDCKSPVNEALPIFSLLLTLFGFTVIVDAVLPIVPASPSLLLRFT